VGARAPGLPPATHDTLLALEAAEDARAAAVPSAPPRLVPAAAAPVEAALPMPLPLPVAVEAAPAEAPIWEKPKNAKRQAAARAAGQASAERTREIHSAVKTNLAPELHVAWEAEGHKFLKEESGRIAGIKDRINAASKISEAFAEKYGAGDAGAYGGDRYEKRMEIEAEHAEKWADEQERAYYAELERDARDAGTIDEDGNPTEARLEDEHAFGAESTNKDDDDPPF
jgi:hypothetical protein